MRSLLSYIPCDCVFLHDDINQNWACWKALLFTAVEECNAPWITKELIAL